MRKLFPLAALLPPTAPTVAGASGASLSPRAAASGASVQELVEHLFRREFGPLTAALVRRLGARHFELAEDSVQQAMMQALRTWPFAGVPRRPAAWLRRVAGNRALDELRRRGTWARKEEELGRELALEQRGESSPAAAPGGALGDGGPEDDALRLLFLCCHPALAPAARVALTLKVAAGFSAREISRAYLLAESTVAQRLVRARQILRRLAEAGELRIGADASRGESWEAAVTARRETVLEALYSLFNAGYNAHEGDQLIRADLCREALRLTRRLALHPKFGDPAAHALASLMAFQSSRLVARQGPIDGPAVWVPLRDQDRSRWDQRLVRRGFEHLAASSAGHRLTIYHLEAAIACHHAGAASWEATAWGEILDLYNQLLELRPSPVVRLNRAVALASVEGPAAALEELAGEWVGVLEDYHWLHATRAHLCTELGRDDAARKALGRALQGSMSDPERRLLMGRLEALESASPTG